MLRPAIEPLIRPPQQYANSVLASIGDLTLLDYFSLRRGQLNPSHLAWVILYFVGNPNAGER